MFTQSELGAVVTTEHESHKFLSSCNSDGAVVGDVRQIKPTNTIAKHSVCGEDLLRLPTARTHGECVKCAFPGPQPTHRIRATAKTFRGSRSQNHWDRVWLSSGPSPLRGDWKGYLVSEEA